MMVFNYGERVSLVAYWLNCTFALHSLRIQATAMSKDILKLENKNFQRRIIKFYNNSTQPKQLRGELIIYIALETL